MTLDRSWEKFVGGPTEAAQNRIHVTLNRGGIIFLNKNAHRWLGSPSGVQLYYNRERDTIGVEPANPRVAISFPVKNKANGWFIHASPFCRHFGIKPSGTEKFVSPLIDNNGILMLDLRNTVRVAGTTRRRINRRKNVDRSEGETPQSFVA